MMLFPTEFVLKTTAKGMRLMATPIEEISQLHQVEYKWQSISAQQANEKLKAIKSSTLHVKMKFTIDPGNTLSLRFKGNELVNIPGTDLTTSSNEIELLIDKTSAEIFINNGAKYIVRNLLHARNENGLEFSSELYGPAIEQLEVYELKSIWNTNK